MNLATAAAADQRQGITVRLSSNESPFGPSPRAMEAAVDALAHTRLYPDDQSVTLREALAGSDGVPIDQVAVAAGSTPLLIDVIGLAAIDGGEVLTFDKAFRAYEVGAANARARHVRAPVGGPATLERGGYERDVDSLLGLVNGSTRIVVVDHPGNPTGAHLDGEQLRSLVERIPEHVTVVIDEAYHHFAIGQRGYVTAAELQLEHPRLVTIRTFSKAHALAGLRAGYLVGPAGLVQGVEARRPRFNISTASQAAAIASLGDPRHVAEVIQGTLAGRRRMAAGLRELEVAFTDSLGNFLTIELGAAARPVVEAYRRSGIGVRPLEPYGMLEQIRVTVGTPEQVETFLDASRDILSRAGC